MNQSNQLNDSFDGFGQEIDQHETDQHETGRQEHSMDQPFDDWDEMTDVDDEQKVPSNAQFGLSDENVVDAIDHSESTKAEPQRPSQPTGSRLKLRSTEKTRTPEAAPPDNQSFQTLQRTVNPRTTLLSLLEPKQLREVRRRLADVHGEAAVEIAKLQIDLAGDQKLRQVKLEGERRRTALRADNTDKSGELMKQAVQSSADAINQQLVAHQEQLHRVINSRCSDQDKEDIRQMIQELSRRQIKKIGGEHGVPS